MSLPLSLSSSLSSHSLSSFSRNRPSLFSLHLSQNPNRLHFRLCAAASAAPADTGTLAKSAIQRIAEKLRTLGFVEETAGSDSDDRVKAGEIFIPNSRQIPNYRVGHTLDPSWSTPQNPVPEPGTGGAITRFHQLRGEVVMEKRKLKERKGEEERVPTVAEVVLPGAELRRLRTVGIGLKRKMKIGKAGITEGIVNGIHERWRSEEVVKIVCEDICRLNMKRTHELLERKTGGMVVWRAGGKIVLYRGVNYKYPYFTLDEASPNTSSVDKMGRDGGIEGQEESGSSAMNQVESAGLNATRRLAESSLIQGVGQPSRVRFQLPGEKQLVEEADRLLDGLGPRFIDWWGYDPIPVDADLLPAVVSGYRRPFRLLPFGVKPKLTNDEMTILKRLGRPLPCHFALGRNRKLQGLAAAILKLWERCEIAKIAVKRGVQNTNSELMAEELKRLTGGTLLSRDKEYIVFYRGKDFLPLAVSSAIEERRRNRMRGTRTHDSSMMTSEDSGTETAAPASVVGSEMTENNMENQEEKTKSAETTRTSRKLAMALGKKARAEKLLAKLEQAEISRPIEVDKEGITEEERYMLRRVGLKMKPFLLLGRRGVFDGTIENMHLHWKYRELVKIICGGRNVDEIHRLARILETESGGILVAVERVRKGHAIIVYRGKNYQRPAALRPSTLLNKKEAMKRSLEAQRRESLKLHVLKLTRNIEGLKLKLVKDKEAHGVQLDDHLTSRSDMDVDVLTPTVPGKVVNSQMDSLNTIHQEKLDMTPSHEHETCEAGQKSLLGFVCLESNVDSVSEAKRDQMLDSACHCDSKASCSDIVNSSSDNVSDDSSLSDSLSNQLAIMTGEVSTDSCDNPVSNDEIIKTSSELYKNEQLSSFHERKDSRSNGLSPRPLPLSNKERLLLRKQALKMKRPPLLAIGKSNVVTGVVKAIKDHFKKHPLVIVNVKGRAKGTSVQEVVFKLEQATGGVLVSQEPSKIILYRGWGGKVESGSCGSKRYDHDKGGSPPPLAVPPQLMEAMRLELGLPSD